MNSPYTIKIFPEILHGNKNWYYGMVGLTAATVVAHDYNLYESNYFLNGLAQSDMNEFAKRIEEIIPLLNFASIEKLILYSAKYNNESLFNYIVDFKKETNFAYCIINSEVTFKYYKKMIDSGTPDDTLMQLILDKCRISHCNPKEYLHIAKQFDLQDKAALRAISEHYGFGDFIGILV